jgi:hypothetical protein
MGGRGSSSGCRGTAEARGGANRRRRAPRLAAVALAAALVLAAAGCGAERHVNEPRPQPPTRVSVAIAKDAITVQPRRIAFGAEPTQQIPQNQHASQPVVRSRAPLDVVLVAANLTSVDSRLELRGNGHDSSSGDLVAGGNGSFQVSLPAGTYRLSAADLPSAKPATLVVGPYRSSSENDLLLP